MLREDKEILSNKITNSEFKLNCITEINPKDNTTFEVFTYQKEFIA